MYYSDDIVEEVRSKNDIVDVVSGYVKLTKKGRDYFGLCPFHNEKTPSFSVSGYKQMYYCFGCGAGGNVFSFLMEYENYSFLEALEELAKRAGVDLPKQEYSEKDRERANEKETLMEIQKAAAGYYYFKLRNREGETALSYLKNRGLSDDTMNVFGLGYAGKYSSHLYQYLKGKGYADEMIAKAGLITVDEKRGANDRFWNRVMFPIMNANHRVIGFGGRVMGDGTPKYLNSPETLIFDKSRNLYGLNRAKSTRESYFLLCEGYMDVIALHQAGFTNAVASLGTALTVGHASLIRRYVKEVYLIYDSDPAGVRATLRAMPILKEAGLSVKVVRLNPYKDPDEFIKNKGAKAFEERIRDAENGFLFSITASEGDYDMDSPEGKTQFMRETAKRLTEFEEEIERNYYVDAVAKKYGVKAEHLRSLMEKQAIQMGLARPVLRAKSARKSVTEKENGLLQSQKALLTWMTENVSIYRQVKEYLKPEDFSGELYKTVAEMIYRQYEEGQLNPARLINHFTEEEEHRQVAALFHTKLNQLHTVQEQEKALGEMVLRIKQNSLDEATKALDPTDMAGLQRLVEARRQLQKMEKITIRLES
ncbi:DNA primase [Suipraeoptans intestinalis]|uniref:DNA primase n=1 Tax=Suipraeoptans intestinalis TaxID=2606628 RepID=UPI0023F51522|nr:DNA primase [Suipraeoptans intestinalis]MDD7770178.1 DNA primase [Suipraeoptans intestinalis]MDY3122671.1 DNA primase [Suipraeoptans intestinalis]